MQCYGYSTLHYVSLQDTCTTIYALGNKCINKWAQSRSPEEKVKGHSGAITEDH